jgi:hypothetical protein
MNRLTTFLRCDVYGVEAREEKRREEKRRGNLNHPASRDRGCCSRFTTAIYYNKVSSVFYAKGGCMMRYILYTAKPALTKTAFSHTANASAGTAMETSFVALECAEAANVVAFMANVVAFMANVVAFTANVVAFGANAVAFMANAEAKTAIADAIRTSESAIVTPADAFIIHAKHDNTNLNHYNQPNFIKHLKTKNYGKTN